MRGWTLTKVCKIKGGPQSYIKNQQKKKQV